MARETLPATAEAISPGHIEEPEHMTKRKPKTRLETIAPGMKPKAADKCQWFLLCTNPATGTIRHPILGEVKICDRCRKRAE
jgi:hypothetical protein